GSAAGRRVGLHVNGTGLVTINVPSGAGVHFDNNSAYGISVEGTGAVQLTGTVTGAQTGTITANGNSFSGLSIQQTPGTVAQNMIEGLVVYGSGRDGARLIAGSVVQLRDSSFLGNGRYGVLVNRNTGATTASSDISKLDLGMAGSNGGNVLQALAGSGNNT